MLSTRTTAKVPQQWKPSTIGLQPTSEDARLFWDVVHKYQRCVLAEPLGSSNPDPTVSRKQRTAAASDFVVDVESATELALKGAGLLPQWHRLARDSVRPAHDVMQQIIRLCTPMYRERGLDPSCYSKTVVHTGGRYSVQRTREKSTAKRCSGYGHRVSKTKERFYCDQHDMQPVAVRIKHPDGDILRLQCGCVRRVDIRAAVPVRESVVYIAALEAVAKLPSGGVEKVSEQLGIAA